MKISKFADLVLPNLGRIEMWLKNGANDKEVAEKLGISPHTLMNYLNRGRAGEEPYVQLLDTYTRARTSANDDVEAALYKSACGYQWIEMIEEMTYDPQGNLISKKVRRRTVDVPPSVVAQQFWLLNKERGVWKPKNDVVIDQPESGIIMIPEVKNE